MRPRRGIVLSLGSSLELHLLTYYRCWFGHSWLYDLGPAPHKRICTRCGKYMVYQIVDSGRSKAWCWDGFLPRPDWFR